VRVAIFGIGRGIEGGFYVRRTLFAGSTLWMEVSPMALLHVSKGVNKKGNNRAVSKCYVSTCVRNEVFAASNSGVEVSSGRCRVLLKSRRGPK